MVFTDTFRLLFVPECKSLFDIELNPVSKNQFTLWEKSIVQNIHNNHNGLLDFNQIFI